MRKIERYLRNLEVHGPEHCPRQFEALTIGECATFVLAELARADVVGLRTDWRPGCHPRDADVIAAGLLPFLHEATAAQALRFWMDHCDEKQGKPLSCLVCESIPAAAVLVQCTAEKGEDGVVFVAFGQAATERDLSGGKATGVQRFAVGSDAGSRVVSPWGDLWPCLGYSAALVRNLHLDEVAALTLADPTGRVAATVTRTGRVLVW